MIKIYAEMQSGSLRKAANSHSGKSAHLCKKDDVRDSVGSGDVDVILHTVRSSAMSITTNRLPPLC